MTGFLTAGCLFSINPAKFQLNSHPYFIGLMKQASYCCSEDNVCVDSNTASYTKANIVNYSLKRVYNMQSCNLFQPQTHPLPLSTFILFSFNTPGTCKHFWASVLLFVCVSALTFLWRWCQVSAVEEKTSSLPFNTHPRSSVPGLKGNGRAFWMVYWEVGMRVCANVQTAPLV